MWAITSLTDHSPRRAEPCSRVRGRPAVSAAMAFGCSVSAAKTWSIVSSLSYTSTPYSRDVACSTASDARGSAGRAVLVPVQHPHGAEGVPAARLALCVIHVEVHRTAMNILQEPSSVLASLAFDQVDRLGTPLVRLDTRAPQVVEPAQHVIEVAGREWEAEHPLVH